MKLWIARDLNGELWLYKNEPARNRRKCIFEQKYGENEPSIRLCDAMFQSVKFDNSPQQVQLSLAQPDDQPRELPDDRTLDDEWQW